LHVAQVVGFQQFTSDTLNAAKAVSTSLLTDQKSGAKANAAWFSVRGSSGGIRFRDDGTAPSATVGMHIPVGLVPFLYQGDLHKLQVIGDTVAGNAEVNITYVLVAD
jgi:hypothetical protein